VNDKKHECGERKRVEEHLPLHSFFGRFLVKTGFFFPSFFPYCLLSIAYKTIVLSGLRNSLLRKRIGYGDVNLTVVVLLHCDLDVALDSITLAHLQIVLQVEEGLFVTRPLSTWSCGEEDALVTLRKLQIVVHQEGRTDVSSSCLHCERCVDVDVLPGQHLQIHCSDEVVVRHNGVGVHVVDARFPNHQFLHTTHVEIVNVVPPLRKRKRKINIDWSTSGFVLFPQTTRMQVGIDDIFKERERMNAAMRVTKNKGEGRRVWEKGCDSVGEQKRERDVNGAA
jgi:hypothetical protein